MVHFSNFFRYTVVCGETTIGTGTVTAACVRRDADGVMKAVEIPAELLARLRARLESA